MAQVRTFIAIALPAEARGALGRRQEMLGAAAARYATGVAPEAVHLTLSFLGNVDESRLPLLAEALRHSVSGLPAFRLSIGALGAFPNARNPRVVWVGLEGDLKALQTLHRAVEEALAPLGFPLEGRDFAPHLTLARLRETATHGDKAQLARSLAEVRMEGAGAVPVDEIIVMKSELARTGAIYTRLYVIPLAK